MAAPNGPELQRLLSAEEAVEAVRERTARTDEIVRRAFSEYLEPAASEGIAAMAVGGFGRRELFPYSDIDVLILLRDNLQATTLRDPIGRFLRELWDAGLRISHSVHIIAECCRVDETNVELSISLLDRRPLAGDAALLADAELPIKNFFRLHGAALARLLARLTRVRHAKHQNSIYHLEPNIKETPGGLRDLQVARWIAALLRHDVPDLDEPWKTIAPLRCFLHETSRRDDNLLSFEKQDAISENPAETMRGYYRQARLVFSTVNDALEAAEQSQPSLIRQFRDWRSRLSNTDFTVSRDRVLLRNPGQLASGPELFFRLLEFIARHGIPASRDAERRLQAAAPEIAKALAGMRFWPELRRVLTLPHASLALRTMQDSGLIAALFPEWARIDCLVVHDYYHRYTVDEHTIVALEQLERIQDIRFKNLLEETPEAALLRLALLLHDAGKGSGRDHSTAAAELAVIIGERIGVPRHEVDIVVQLIAQHLTLSQLMSTRDLEDPQTARLLAQQVGTVEQLKMLALLTYADISAVNPTALTPWKADQLWSAYLSGYQQLTSELDSVRVHDFGQAGAEVASFIEGLPERYLRTHSLLDIERHAALAESAAMRGVALELTRNQGYWEVVVAAQDRPFLLASIAGALAAFGMNILKAEAFANARGIILDFFTFADPLRTLELNPTESDRLRDTLARVVLGKQDVQRLLASRPRPARKVTDIEARATFNNKASRSATLIEIVAPDRPGLLYDLTGTMSRAGCDIVLVLIDTEGQKALDVFYVTAEGQKLDEAKQAALQRDLQNVF